MNGWEIKRENEKRRKGEGRKAGRREGRKKWGRVGGREQRMKAEKSGKKQRKMVKKRLLFPSFPPELLKICSREILCLPQMEIQLQGVNGQATKHNDGPRQPGVEAGEAKSPVPSLLRMKLPFASSIFLTVWLTASPPAPNAHVCSSLTPSSPPVLFSQHQAQGWFIFPGPDPSRELWSPHSPHPLLYPNLSPLSPYPPQPVSYPSVVRMCGN